jgi:hexosaminidase
MLDPKLKPEEYRLTVSDRIVIAGRDYRAVAMGTTTLLQALHTGRTLPKMAIVDRPASSYRGLMIDVARQFHSIAVLEQCVELCRLYKLNYLQLHLTDDQSFMFPSEAFPLITKANQNGATSYTKVELKNLVKFADDRGVTIVPEMDIPGHSASLIRAMPDIFKVKGTTPYEHHATINFANEKVIKAVETLIGEICEVFHSSPYFHMGGDEADIANAWQNPDFQAAFKKHGLPDKSQQEIYRLFINQVDEMVKKRHKMLIVWEGFGRDPASKFPIPKDVLVMEFENAYYSPLDLLKDGYEVINASWTPLYVVNRDVWSADKVYDWDLTKFGRFSNLYPTTTWFQAPSRKGIVGAQTCSWEAPEYSEIENLRRMIPAMAERVWSAADSKRSYASTVQTAQPSKDHQDQLLRLSPPNAKDDATQPVRSFRERLLATDALLERLIHSVSIQAGPTDAEDPNDFDVPCFTKPLTVRLKGSGHGVVRFTLDGKPPTDNSIAYELPIVLTQTTTIRAAEFPSSINPKSARNPQSSKTFYYVTPKMPNLATGKKVTVSGGTQGAQAPELAVDDNLDLASSWWATGPQWLQVDLGKVTSIGRVEVFPYWDGSRYYQYTVEASEDGKTWIMLADRSKNTIPASSTGDEIKFQPITARYVKITMLKNSVNEGVHLVELRVW